MATTDVRDAPAARRFYRPRVALVVLLLLLLVGLGAGAWWVTQLTYSTELQHGSQAVGLEAAVIVEDP